MMLGMSLISVIKMWSAMIARLFAMTTFLNNPLINLKLPSIVLSNVILLLLNWLAISWYLTMGPAISCGKKDINKPNFMGLLSALLSFIVQFSFRQPKVPGFQIRNLPKHSEVRCGSWSEVSRLLLCRNYWMFSSSISSINWPKEKWSGFEVRGQRLFLNW